MRLGSTLAVYCFRPCGMCAASTWLRREHSSQGVGGPFRTNWPDTRAYIRDACQCPRRNIWHRVFFVPCSLYCLCNSSFLEKAGRRSETAIKSVTWREEDQLITLAGCAYIIVQKILILDSNSSIPTWMIRFRSLRVSLLPPLLPPNIFVFCWSLSRTLPQFPFSFRIQLSIH